MIHGRILGWILGDEKLEVMVRSVTTGQGREEVGMNRGWEVGVSKGSKSCAHAEADAENQRLIASH